METNTVRELITSAKDYCDHEHFQEAIHELQKIPNADKNGKAYQLLTASYVKLGDIDSAMKNIEQAVAEESGEPIYASLLAEVQELLTKRNLAVTQIEEGRHNSEAIQFAKENSKELIENCCFDAAKDQLTLLAAARKVKTTNILWIGNYLKDIYFHPKAAYIKEHFSRLLLSEITFYYLKACKLFEPEYKEIQEALKKVKESKREKPE